MIDPFDFTNAYSNCLKITEENKKKKIHSFFLTENKNNSSYNSLKNKVSLDINIFGGKSNDN